ncbi:MAG: helix-turn-helix domain-containing protein [Alphaproteobacteria bacterium]|nr:helix-turn-helix domain-containing protein [Alphaproteobacteria bacterium]
MFVSHIILQDLHISHCLDLWSFPWHVVRVAQKTAPVPAAPARRRARAYARQTREAVALLGQLIRAARIERQLSVQALAERVGVSRDLMQRIELGDPRVGLGVAFEAATVVGVPLFTADPLRLAAERARQDEKLRLLPKAVRRRGEAVKDDF